MWRKLSAPIFLLAVLAACATPTPYQPAVRGENGYIDRAVERDRILIAFHGNSATPRATVEASLLHRAAEVTLERGGDHFVILDRDVERTGFYSGSNVDFGITYGAGFGNFNRGVFYGAGFGGPAIISEVPTYSANAEILVRKGPKPADDIFAFDARDVIANIGPTLTRPKSRR